jgi:hypothetical protein
VQQSLKRRLDADRWQSDDGREYTVKLVRGEAGDDVDHKSSVLLPRVQALYIGFQESGPASPKELSTSLNFCFEITDASKFRAADEAETSFSINHSRPKARVLWVQVGWDVSDLDRGDELRVCGAPLRERGDKSEDQNL